MSDEIKVKGGDSWADNIGCALMILAAGIALNLPDIIQLLRDVLAKQ